MQHLLFVMGAAIIGGIVLSVIILDKMRRDIKRETQVNKQFTYPLESREHITQEQRQKGHLAREIELQMKYQAALLEQRRQIADDIHDELSSSLAALKFYVDDIYNQAANTGSAAILRDIAAEIDAVYGRTRQYMHSLKHNNTAIRFSITTFLQDIRQKLQGKKLMALQLEMDDVGIRQHLSIVQHDQLYHMIKESITNVIKHAEAGLLRISICFQDGVCLFMVEDNGNGFVESQVLYGMGIESMKCRINKLKGAIKITSSSSGTIVAGSFPVNVH